MKRRETPQECDSTPPDIQATQAWFWTPGWQEGEAEAVAEIARGDVRLFASGTDFLASLDE
jgi:hypothetical protein